MTLPFINKALTQFNAVKQKLPFGNRPAHTVLYITEAKTFRIDCNNKGIIIGDVLVEDCRCESSANIPTCLEQSNKNQRLGKKVWILFSRLNTYALSLPSVQVTGVDNTILEQALLFEYEALSGESTQHSQLAYQFVGEEDEMSSFWLSILPKETYTRVQESCKKQKVQLGGITHPGGLPFFLSSADSPSWLRVECWPDSVFALAKTPESGFKMHILHTDNHSWQDELDQWIVDSGEIENSEAIMNNKVEFIPQTDEILRLTQDGALVYWLGLWAGYFIKGEAKVPLLRHVSTVNKELIYMIGSGVLALAICGGHFGWNLKQRNQFEYQIEQLDQAKKDLELFGKAVTTGQTKLSSLNKQLRALGDNVEVIPDMMSALQKRPAELLKALANKGDPDLIIESIQFADQVLLVKGVSLRPHLSNQLANRIEPVLLDLGWKVNSPTKDDMDLFAQGGPWSFEMQIEDLGLEGFAKD